MRARGVEGVEPGGGRWKGTVVRGTRARVGCTAGEAMPAGPCFRGTFLAEEVYCRWELFGIHLFDLTRCAGVLRRLRRQHGVARNCSVHMHG